MQSQAEINSILKNSADRLLNDYLNQEEYNESLNCDDCEYGEYENCNDCQYYDRE